MLDAPALRILGIVMLSGAILGLVVFRPGAPRGDRPREVRASANPPKILQVLWPALVSIAVFSPLLAAIAPDLATSSVLNVSFPFDAIVQVIGFLLWEASGLLVLWSARALGRFMVPDVVVSSDHELIRTGPYAHVRHPTYAGAIGMATGMALLFLSLPFAGLAVATIVLANYRATKEERLLASPEGFGETYRTYMRTTGRFLPKVRR